MNVNLSRQVFLLLLLFVKRGLTQKVRGKEEKEK